MPTSRELPRSLTRFDAAMIIVGNMIGIGIFTTTGYYAEYLDAPATLLVVWLLGGVYAFCGALTYAELATRFPHAGGDYIYLTRAYHPLMGFLFGWSTFTVTYTGSIAAIAIGFAYYFSRLLPPAVQSWEISLGGTPVTLSTINIIAIGVTFLLTYLNSRGIQAGKRFQNFFSVLGMVTLAGFILVGFFSGKGDPAHFHPFWPAHIDAGQISRAAVALIGIIFTYSGWTSIVYIAGEVRRPRRNIPTAMATAVIAVTFLYLLMNAVYLYALPLTQMSGNVEIGYRVLQVLVEKRVGLAFSLIIMVMVLSTLNATVLSGARIYYAMAREGRFFPPAAKLHPQHRVPANSLWMQFAWAGGLMLLGTFNTLLTYSVFVMVLFSALAGLALFVLRWRERRRATSSPEVYSVTGFPVVPLIYLLISGYVMLNTLVHRPGESLWGVGAVLSGIPFYFLFRWWHRRK